MKIKKLGHCCLLIQTEKVTILTDPGKYSTLQNEVVGVDIVLITHEHSDHLHVDSLKKILKNNPDAKIITNTSVGKILSLENISHEVVSGGEKNNSHGVLIEGYGEAHAPIYHSLYLVENTGYFIDDTFFYPGDAFTNPNRPVNILALPVAGSWVKLQEAVDYGLLLKPRIAFPVHDAILSDVTIMHRAPGEVLPQNGIEFVSMVPGDERDF